MSVAASCLLKLLWADSPRMKTSAAVECRGIVREWCMVGWMRREGVTKPQLTLIFKVKCRIWLCDELIVVACAGMCRPYLPGMDWKLPFAGEGARESQLP
jgi:hypothetical protein